MFSKQTRAVPAGILLIGLVAVCPAQAQTTWNYQVFHGPASLTLYQPNAINNAGTVAGTFSGQASSGAFIAQGNTFITFGNGDTQLNGINNAGVTTGIFYDANADVVTPYVRAANGTITKLAKLDYGDVPQGINGAGKVVGYSTDINFSIVHGAIWNGGIETVSDYPGAIDTVYYGINNADKIVGDTNTINGGDTVTAFVLENGVYTPISVPGASVTVAGGINNANQILGRYQDASGNFHGFLLANGGFTTLDFLGLDSVFGLTFTDSDGKLYNRQNSFTVPFGFNDRTDFVGVFGASYQGADGTGFLFREQAFKATAVPEPGAFALLGAAVATCTTFMLRRRHRRQRHELTS